MTKATLAVLTLALCLSPVMWAAEAPEPLSPDEAYRQLPSYTYDQPRRLLRFLEAEIQEASGDPLCAARAAEGLAKVLADPQATLDAKRFACRWLPLVATDGHVPAVARLLEQDETAEMARQALQAIPGEASLAVLRDGLSKAKGEAVVGFINALGARRDATSVDAIAAHLKAQDAVATGAAADALGTIGTVAAAEALGVAAKLAEGPRADALSEARLLCAQRLSEDGKRDAAVGIHKDLVRPAVPLRYRVAALVGLSESGGAEGWSAVERALEDDNPTLRATAIRASGRLEGSEVTKQLAAYLPTLSARDQGLLLAALADRGDAAARPGVLRMMNAGDEAVRAAAVRALATLGTADDVPALLALAAEAQGAEANAAREALARLDAKGADERVLDAAAKGDGATRLAGIQALADRQASGADAVLLDAAAKGDVAVRVAAIEALAEVGPPNAYPKLVELLAGAQEKSVAAAAQTAAVAVGRRSGDEAGRVGAVRSALEGASAAATGRLLALLPALGDTRGLALLDPYLKGEDSGVRDAAVRALVAWPDSTAANRILDVARESESRTHRALALRAYMRLMQVNPDGAARVRMMTLVRPLAATPEAKKLFLAGLAGMREPWALKAAEAYLQDPDVKAEAQAAVETIRRGGKKQPAPRKATVPPADPKRLAARRKQLAESAPYGSELVGYLDCGPQTSTGGQGQPALRVAAGAAFVWGGADRTADVRYGTIAFDNREVVVEATNLDPKRSYRLGFSWWDYDHNTRAQSVWAAPQRGKAPPVRLLPTTKLPSGKSGEKPAEKTIPLPRDLTKAGGVRVVFRNEAEPNVVVSEVWLLAGDAGNGESTLATDTSASAKAEPATVKRSARKDAFRVLLVTGVDHPGHKWRQTTPVLREAIEADPRLAVDVVEDPAWLETGDLAPYKAVVHHWMDWKVPAPGPKARANLERFVRGGKGLVLVHFGCGAWQDWPGFVQLAGRVWDPDLRGHDRRGPFTVDIVDTEHPITRGLKAFETTDELYTCLAGDRKIHVLAKATSKVDHKDYPMAFVLSCGRGRVFHCALGHDVKAFESEAVKTLYRRGTAWAATLEVKP